MEDMLRDSLDLVGTSIVVTNLKAQKYTITNDALQHQQTSTLDLVPIMIDDDDEFELEIGRKPNNKVQSPRLLRNVHNPISKIKSQNKRIKSSSTASLFLETTISAPDTDEVIKCSSKAIYWNIVKNDQIPDLKLLDIFSEEKYPLDRSTNVRHIPSEDAIRAFITKIFIKQSLSAECGVMCMAYLDRLAEVQHVLLHRTNWRRLVLGALILASKVWEEQAVWNADFLSMFPNLVVENLNELERQYLNLLSFNVSLSASVYAKFYFELKSLSPTFALKPLSRDAKKRLEEKSLSIEQKHKRKNLRTQSMDNFMLKERQHVID
eukprot:TRINITY_DN179_c0_g1_i1.p1 TRINITY_DN179_c0_g1~~TRINITY_DN179_c0_g1_i1.p1  ORF type:complete len:322 (-),score=41.57 TRINITY_DN179_c0_g1_i1:45-1010(-)